MLNALKGKNELRLGEGRKLGCCSWLVGDGKEFCPFEWGRERAQVQEPSPQPLLCVSEQLARLHAPWFSHLQSRVCADKRNKEHAGVNAVLLLWG